MRYTQSQIRDLLSISVDAFRVWRDAVPALTKHRGHAPTFTPGDVVAIAVLAGLVTDFGLRVGVVGERLNRLFETCHGRSWLALENCIVIVEVDAIRLVDSSSINAVALTVSSICVPCAPIVARLQALLVAAEAEQTQGHLQFPPTAIATGASR